MRRDVKDGVADGVGGSHAARVRRPPAALGEPGGELVGSASGVGAIGARCARRYFSGSGTSATDEGFVSGEFEADPAFRGAEPPRSSFKSEEKREGGSHLKPVG
ncbi:hypothetical protein LUX05_04765 [Streptomyces somaliensis]|uniref:hypothetical protein n=1 Tax=Streptomyces somaliensis TaxID=78355 RepID=UPI0034E95AB0|nr:hypothetical protein [Streptomyces somaliensis]MCP9973650.1 hypothetical protein [Streptomyces somaliensis]